LDCAERYFLCPRVGVAHLPDNGATLEVPTQAHGITGKLWAVFRLRGPLSSDPAARTLHALLLCILIWSAAYFIVLTPFASLVARRGAAFVLILAFDITAAISLAVLRRGSLRTAAVIYFAGYWLSFTVLILFSGGIRSPGLVFYAAMPISAA